MKRIITFAIALITMMMSADMMAQSDYPGVYYDQNDGFYHQWADPWPTFYKHELHSQHFDIFYGSGYGTTPPDKLPTWDALYVDVQDMLNKAEWFYDIYVNELAFTEPNRTRTKDLRMAIFIICDTGWLATGAGNSDTGALWCTPMTMHPVGSTIAHEIGHSFQYQVNCDYGGNTGFRYANGNGSTFWEQTANWQAVYIYPGEMYGTSMGVYRFSHNMAFTHEWHRYQSYWMHFYWVDKYGKDAVGKIWRAGTGWGDDASTTFRKLHNMSVADLYREYCDAAMHFVTWDFQNADWKARGAWDVGNFVYDYVPIGVNKFQVSYQSCPQSTGFNVIELNVPSANTEITTHFTALTPGCKLAQGDKRMFWNGAAIAPISTDNYNSFWGEEFRGFRLGYVALLNDGTRQYYTPDEVFCTGREVKSADVSYTVPANVQRLWLVVSPALTDYNTHDWDENILNDDQWPYQVGFTNTTIVGSSFESYFYDKKTGTFLSRGGNNGKMVAPDEFGLPLAIGFSGEKAHLQMLDNRGGYLSGTTSITTTAASPSNYVMETCEDGYMFSVGGCYLTTDGTKVTMIRDKASATVWQLLTQAERDAILKDNHTQQEHRVALQSKIQLGKASLSSYVKKNLKSTDVTAKVTNAALKVNTDGWTVTGSAPAAESNVLEVFGGSGTTISQTVSGLQKGLYRLTLNGFYRDGLPDACVGYYNAGYRGMSNAYVSANDAVAQIADWASARSSDTYPNWRSEANESFGQGRYLNELYTSVGDDGQLTISIVTPQYIDGGWFCFSNLHLYYYGMPSADSYEYIIHMADDAPANGGYDVIDLLQSGTDSYVSYTPITEDNVADYVVPRSLAEYKGTVTISGSDITVGYQPAPQPTDIHQATPSDKSRQIANGKYYIRNRKSGTFLAAGNAYGTSASLSPVGLDFSITMRSGGTYTFNSNVSSGDNANFLAQPRTLGGEETYVDGAAFNYVLTKVDDESGEFYTIAYAGTSPTFGDVTMYLGYDESNPELLAVNLFNPDDEAAQWEMLSRAELIAELKEKARFASADNPLDMTNYIAAYNFSRNDNRNSSWKGTPTIYGMEDNYCAEKFNTTFDVYQTLTNLPAGTYRFEMQGFYRYGSTADASAARIAGKENVTSVIYAGTEETPLMSIFDEAANMSSIANTGGAWSSQTAGNVPDNMEAASLCFSAGLYNNSVTAEVGGDGKLRIGVRNKNASQPEANWTIFDNARLYLIAPATDPLAIDRVSDDGKVDDDTNVYDLAGRKIGSTSNLTKGIYIVGGKKVMVK